MTEEKSRWDGMKSTYEHRKEVQRIAKDKGYSFPFHDLDKYGEYLLLGKEQGSKTHRQLADHHYRDGDIKNKIEAAIDWQSARYTKPDKPLNAYETWKKYYPDVDMQETMEQLDYLPRELPQGISQDVLDFYRLLDDYSYASCDFDQQLFYPKNPREWDDHCMVMSPRLFHELKGGCCWDYCIAQADFFNQHKYVNWNFCLLCEHSDFELRNHCTPMTHTFTLYQETDGHIYYFEQSFKKMRGIYGPYDDINTALMTTFKWLCDNNPNGRPTRELHVHRPLNGMTFGMNSYQYCEYMRGEPLIWYQGQPYESILDKQLT